ncbi:MAG TPA: amidase [Actinoplanes sp.]
MTTWIQRFDVPSGSDPAGPGPGLLRVAVKDAIDVAGFVTTAGCVAVRDRAVPAAADAACLAGVRAGASLVGKTTLTELCASPVGDNEEFGTPVNPLAPGCVPGGSSSGSAVAVATGEADIGLGTDTGGSVRIPAACCGIVGLKPTWGRIPSAGVWPLAPSLDVVGPLARTVAEVADGMRLLTAGPGGPGAAGAVAAGGADRGRVAQVAGRLRIDGVDPGTEDAIDAALDAAGIAVRPVRLPGWDGTFDAFETIILGEWWRAHRELLDLAGLGDFVREGLRAGRSVTASRLADAMLVRDAWRAEVAAVFAEVDVLALPTLVGPPPPLTAFAGYPFTLLTSPFNLAGVPALAMPVPAPGFGSPGLGSPGLGSPGFGSPGFAGPASLQLVGPADSEALLCATGMAIEAALPSPASSSSGLAYIREN